MNVLMSTALATVVSVAAVTTASGAQPSVAAQAGPAEKQMRGALLRNSDVPAWLSAHPKRTTRYRQPGRAGDRPLLCFEDRGSDIYGQRPKARAHAQIDLGGDEDKGSALEAANSIYSYGTAARASRAWVGIVDKAIGCPADATIVRKNPSERVTIRQKTQWAVTPRHLGLPGFTLRQRVWVTGTGTKDFDVVATKYTAYRVVGACVERVSLNRSTRSMADVQLAGRDKAWVRSRTDRVADRLSASCGRTSGLG